MIEINIDSNEIRRIANMLEGVPKGVEKATSNSINRALQSLSTAASRKVRERYNIKSSSINRTVHRANNSNLSGRFVSKGSPLPLSQFKVNPRKPSPRRKKPIFVSVKKTGGSVNGAFVANLDGGHMGVFKRAGKSRLPINQLYGPSSPQMIGESKIIDELSEHGKEVFIRRFSHEANRLLGRL